MKTSQLQELLDGGVWEGAFDERTFERAAAYYRTGHVVAVQHLSIDGVDLLLGAVKGSERKPYDCSIRIARTGRTTDFDSTCSCPVGAQCKHAAAVLMMATDRPHEFWPGGKAKPMPAWFTKLQREPEVPDALADWTRWLNSLDPAGQLQQVHSAAPDRQFGVLLRAATHGNPPGLLVGPAWLRPGKTKAAALADPRPMSLHQRDGPVPAPADGWPSEVAAALALLLPTQTVSAVGQTWIRIEALHQQQALETLLAHYPAYYERGSVPLSRDSSRPLRMQWVDLPDGNQRLDFSVEAAGPVQLLMGARLWYVLPQEQRFGLVDAQPSMLAAMAHVPLVRPEQVAALRTRLTQSAAIPLPLPAERSPVEIIDVAPVPVLQLRVVRASVGRSYSLQEFGCAVLAFDYAEVRIAPGIQAPTQRHLHGSRVLQIQRRPPDELQAAKRLQALGFERAGAYPANGIHTSVLHPHDLLLRPHRQQPPWLANAWQPVIEQLLENGFRIEYADDFPHEKLVAIDDWHAEVKADGQHWFDVSLGIDVGGERIDLLPILRRVLEDPSFPLEAPHREKKNASWRVSLDENRSIEMPLARLRALIEPLLEWLQGSGELKLHRSRADALDKLASAAQIPWRGGELLRAHLDLLKQASRSVKPPRGFKATLRPYQQEGLAWLDFLGRSGLGGILADDMGLGKTVQVLAHILAQKQRGHLDQPVLVVAPTSLVGNWRDEAARFAPKLKVLVLHGANRAEHYDHVAAHDLVITTYPLLSRDEEHLRQMRFALLVLDEAQAIKNPRSQAAQVVRVIPAARRLAMTGTPLENHLGELWAQLDAVEPGLLGSEREFTRLYRTPIEKHGDLDRQRRLNQRIGALLLRRRKQDVLTDLPAKTEIVHKLDLEGDQRHLYEALRVAQHERIQQAVQERGLAQSGIIVLDALLKLRQACCDPRLVKLPSARKIKQSAKLDALLELLDGLVGEGRRVLLFSQFTEMLALIETALTKRKIGHQILTGQTPARERSALVKQFQSGHVPVFLISLKAGGVGLNLTAADTVIHYDPWWNPAVEAQATDRAHRIGQDKPVFVYRLICSGTVEEKIQAMQGRKAELARAVLEGGGATRSLRFDEADLAELFAPLA